jgi:sigma-B regulation protein RsbQ
MQESSMARLRARNNVHVSGSGPATIFFAHGFGCDQNMWRFMQPSYARRFRTVCFDLVGSGNSDLAAYDPRKYSSLQGYADDVGEIVDAYGQGPNVFVGHSVSAMIGMLANIAAPQRFAAQVMVGPSPCYINVGDYVGGFER